MNTPKTFSRSPLPGVRDDKTLANWQAGGKPLDVVLPLSIAAGWAYADKPVFDLVMERRGLAGAPSTFIEVVNDAMFVCARAYLQPVGNGAIVAFRGTEPTDLINWLADATVQRVAFHAKPPGAPHGYVHGGFYRNTRAIWPNVIEALYAMKPEWFYITGHSFGAALAVLAGALLADYKQDPGKSDGYGRLWDRLKGIFTFGQPLVGDQDFVNAYTDTVGDKLVRFVYAHDIVPHLPPKTRGWTPVPFGKEFRAPDGLKWTDDHTWTDAVTDALSATLLGVASWVQAQVGVLPTLTLPYSWGDHAPNNYVRVSLPEGMDSGSEFD
jgi:hypothetical protein